MSVSYHHELPDFRELMSFEERMLNGGTLRQGVGTVDGKVVFYIDGFIKESAAIPFGEIQPKIQSVRGYCPQWCRWQFHIHCEVLSGGFEVVYHSGEEEEVVKDDGIVYVNFYTCQPPLSHDQLLRDIRYAYIVQAGSDD